MDDVAECIRRHNVKIAPDYKHWGRTIGSLGYAEMAPLRQAFPEDFERIQFWFPDIEAEFIRYEQVGKERAEE